MKAERTEAALPSRICTRAVCGKAIDPKRVARGSSFCSNECRNDDKRERRAHHASISCRTCGRRKSRQTVNRTAPESGGMRDGRAGQHRGQEI